MKNYRNAVHLRIQQSLHFLNRTPGSEIKAGISSQQLETLLSTINEANCSTFAAIATIVRHRGHLCNGFQSPAALLKKKTDLSPSYLSRNLSAATLYLELDPNMMYLSCVTEATFREFLTNDFDFDTSTKIWQKILEDKKLTRIKSSHVRKAMLGLGIKGKVAIPKTKVKLSKEVNWTVQRYVKKFSNAVMPNIRSKDQWRIFCSCLYKQLLDSCPLNYGQDEVS